MDPAPNPTPFFCDFKDTKKIFFQYIILLTYPQAYYLQFCVEVSFCKHYFSLLNSFMRKEKDPEPDPDPYL
jgi:hypothetical protein